MLLIALASILYGSVMAFTQTNARLIVGYSSIAQLGFITLGIFALDKAAGRPGRAAADGQPRARGRAAVLHRSRCSRERSAGSEDLRDMGGIAFRAPVLAALFLIVALATLAMPGSANFVGEFLILLGVFNAKMVVRDHRLARRRAGVRLHAAALHPLDAQPRAGGDVESVRSAARRARAGAARARDRGSRSTRSWRSTTPSRRSSAPSRRRAAGARGDGRRRRSAP